MGAVFGPNPRRDMQMVNSIGEGLKAVGQNWNKPGLAAFAGTAGSAMTGGAAGDKQYFNELAQATKINDAYDTAQTRTELMRQRLLTAQKLGTYGTRGAAWQTSEPGRFDMAEKAVRATVESRRKQLQEDLKGMPRERAAAQKQLDQLEQETRQRVYPGYGLDAGKYNTYRDAGKPVFGTSGQVDLESTGKQAHLPKTWDDFQATVKPGDYYWTKKNGKDTLMRRTSAVPLPADDPNSPLAQVPTYPKHALNDEGDEDESAEGAEAA